MVKMAGQMLYANTNRTGGGGHIIVNRLPRLLTARDSDGASSPHGGSLTGMLPMD
jgi:hypothetical protein